MDFDEMFDNDAYYVKQPSMDDLQKLEGRIKRLETRSTISYAVEGSLEDGTVRTNYAIRLIIVALWFIVALVLVGIYSGLLG